MSDDSVSLAKAWREREASGDTGPVTVTVTGAGWTVKLRGTTIATFAARYKADARAEQAARKLPYYTTRQDTT